MDTSYTLYIKNMVCDRCIMAVRDLLSRLGLPPLSVVLGKAELAEKPSDEMRERLGSALQDIGFELIEDPNHRITEQIKQLIIDLAHRQNSPLKVNLSQYITERCGAHHYSKLSKIFSETQGTTIERYFLAQKIERAKELLEYGDLTLSEIADRLNYSSTAHLSAQFKALTGFTPRQYKQQAKMLRKPLDKV